MSGFTLRSGRNNSGDRRAAGSGDSPLANESSLEPLRANQRGPGQGPSNENSPGELKINEISSGQAVLSESPRGHLLKHNQKGTGQKMSNERSQEKLRTYSSMPGRTLITESPSDPPRTNQSLFCQPQTNGSQSVLVETNLSSCSQVQIHDNFPMQLEADQNECSRVRTNGSVLQSPEWQEPAEDNLCSRISWPSDQWRRQAANEGTSDESDDEAREEIAGNRVDQKEFLGREEKIMTTNSQEFYLDLPENKRDSTAVSFYEINTSMC